MHGTASVEIQQLSWEGAGHVCSRVVTEAFVPQDMSGLLWRASAAAVGRY